MVKQIIRDIFFLGQPSEPATKADIQVGKDLQDTLQANRERCVGMAANMIGVKKNIIIVNMGFIDVVMFNPVIVSKHDMYETEEGCLSLVLITISNSCDPLSLTPQHLHSFFSKQLLYLH